jgi:hypothetical protein
VASVAVIVTLALAMVSADGAATSVRRTGTPAAAIADGVIAGSAAPGSLTPGSPTPGSPPPEHRAPRSPVQENPEQVDPGLRREHERLLAQRPAFQHLPYRDREIGVGFDRVLASGALELLVTYLGSRASAVADMHRLLGRYGDPGTAYVERYERVF